MTLWTDIATYRGPTPNHGGPSVEQRGVVIHIAEGGFEGTIAWQKNPTAQVSSHFVVAADGRIAQMLDTALTAWTQQAGNGHWISVENEGHTPNPLTAAQVDANARILAKAHQVYGVPLVLATSPNGHGLGHHSMGTAAEGWGGATWGHSDCPGPAIKAQKPDIIARAQQILGGTDDMATINQADWDALIWRTHAIINNLPAVAAGPTKGEVNQLHVALASAGPGAPAVVDAAAIAKAVNDEMHNRLAQ